MVKIRCYVCGKTFERKKCKIDRAEKHYCSNDCRYKGQESLKHKSCIKDGYVHLEITKGNITLLDEEDKDLAVNWQSRKNYAAKKGKDGKHICMHRLIMERILGRPLINEENVDHRNGNKLDNRRENLQLATSLENGANTMKPERIKSCKKSSSKYKGVSLCKINKKWRARITFSYKAIDLGYYDSEEDAAIAYDKAAIRIFKKFAKLNFPNNLYALEIHKKNGCAYKAEA